VGLSAIIPGLSGLTKWLALIGWSMVGLLALAVWLMSGQLIDAHERLGAAEADKQIYATQILAQTRAVDALIARADAQVQQSRQILRALQRGQAASAKRINALRHAQPGPDACASALALIRQSIQEP